VIVASLWWMAHRRGGHRPACVGCGTCGSDGYSRHLRTDTPPKTTTLMYSLVFAVSWHRSALAEHDWRAAMWRPVQKLNIILRGKPGLLPSWNAPGCCYLRQE